MTRVNFYILPDDQPASLQHYACKLAEQDWQSGNRVLIQTDTSEDSKLLDDLLWNIRADSFIPHGIATLEPVDQQHPILISHQKLKNNDFKLLINLSSRPVEITPDNAEAASAEKMIAELLNQDEQRIVSGRQHYKVYRELGYSLQHHKLETING